MLFARCASEGDGLDRIQACRRHGDPDSLMDYDSQNAGAGMPTSFDMCVEDLLVTDSFLIKGKVEGKFTRLAKTLQDHGRDFLVVSNATMVDVLHGEVIRTPRVHVNTREILFAHELVDAGGDYWQQQLSEADERIRIRTFFHGHVNIELAGKIRPQAYESGLLERDYFVMADCTVRGFDVDGTPELAIVSELPYAIVSAKRISYLYDFS